MLQITAEFKSKIVAALLSQRENFGGTDQQFATQYNINGSVYSRLKTATTYDGLLKDAQWLNIGRELDVTLAERKWNVVRTEVFETIEEDVTFCQAYSKSLIFVDDCGIGKTVAAKHLSKKLKNCFYIDCKQAKTKQAFIKLLAKTVGVDDKGKYLDIKANLKYALKMLPNPVVLVDDAGYLEYTAYMEMLEFLDATDGICGWYQIGDDSLREKIKRGINGKKVGYRAMFSRFNERYNSIVPIDKHQRLDFYKKLITDVLNANMPDKSKLKQIVTKCLTNDSGEISGLRRAQSLIILNS